MEIYRYQIGQKVRYEGKIRVIVDRDPYRKDDASPEHRTASWNCYWFAGYKLHPNINDCLAWEWELEKEGN